MDLGVDVDTLMASLQDSDAAAALPSSASADDDVEEYGLRQSKQQSGSPSRTLRTRTAQERLANVQSERAVVFGDITVGSSGDVTSTTPINISWLVDDLPLTAAAAMAKLAGWIAAAPEASSSSQDNNNNTNTASNTTRSTDNSGTKTPAATPSPLVGSLPRPLTLPLMRLLTASLVDVARDGGGHVTHTGIARARLAVEVCAG